MPINTCPSYLCQFPSFIHHSLTFAPWSAASPRLYLPSDSCSTCLSECLLFSMTSCLSVYLAHCSQDSALASLSYPFSSLPFPSPFLSFSQHFSIMRLSFLLSWSTSFLSFLPLSSLHQSSSLYLFPTPWSPFIPVFLYLIYFTLLFTSDV